MSAVGHPAAVALPEAMAVAAHLDHQPVREGVDHRDPHAVKAARDLVALAAELAAGVELGHDDLEGGLAELRHLLDRDAPAVVDHPHRTIRQHGDVDAVAEPGERLVDRVVDHLVDQMVQAAGPGRPDVHARAACGPAPGLRGPGYRRRRTCVQSLGVVTPSGWPARNARGRARAPIVAAFARAGDGSRTGCDPGLRVYHNGALRDGSEPSATGARLRGQRRRFGGAPERPPARGRAGRMPRITREISARELRVQLAPLRPRRRQPPPPRSAESRAVRR